MMKLEEMQKTPRKENSLNSLQLAKKKISINYQLNLELLSNVWFIWDKI